MELSTNTDYIALIRCGVNGLDNKYLYGLYKQAEIYIYILASKYGNAIGLMLYNMRTVVVVLVLPLHKITMIYKQEFLRIYLIFWVNYHILELMNLTTTEQ